jgi:hypothetical protein
MRKIDRIACVTVFGILVCFCVSCTPGIRLNTQLAQDSEVTGTYTVIFYGCNFYEDFETIAFLDKEGDQYIFEPYAPDFKYRIRKGVGAKEALAEATNFLHCNTAFQRPQLSKIIAPSGVIVGYEVRPLYYPFVYGSGDVLLKDYRIKDHKVVIWIKLAPWVENMLSGGSGKNDGK